MSTLLELVETGHLVKLDPNLEPDELEQRCIYLFPHVTRQIERFAGSVSSLGIEQTPLEQLDDLVSHFARGGRMASPRQFHIMMPGEDGIWEMKTSDLRLFGWFTSKDIFVCTSVLDTQLVKGTQDRASSGTLYAGVRNEALRHKEHLNLDEPKFIPGKDPQDVVSDFDLTKP